MGCILPLEDPGELSLQAGVPKEVGRSRPLDHEVDVAVGPRRGSRDRSENGEAGAVLPAPALDRLPREIDEFPYPRAAAVRRTVELRLVEPRRLAADAPYGKLPAKSPHLPAPVAVPEPNPTMQYAPVRRRDSYLGRSAGSPPDFPTHGRSGRISRRSILLVDIPARGTGGERVPENRPTHRSRREDVDRRRVSRSPPASAPTIAVHPTRTSNPDDPPLPAELIPAAAGSRTDAVENDTGVVPPAVSVPDGGEAVYPLGGSTVYVAPDVNPANVIELADVYFVRPAIVTPHIVPLARPLSVNVSTNVPDAAVNVIGNVM